MEFDDLVGYGMIGLMDAISKFDKSKGMKFSTYASIRIKGAMIIARSKYSISSLSSRALSGFGLLLSFIVFIKEILSSSENIMLSKDTFET